MPILNLLIQWIDRAASSPLVRRLNPAGIGKTLTPRRRHLVYMGLWAAVFVAMQALTATGVRLTRGDVLLGLGRIDEAVAEFEAVVQADANHPLGLSKFGLALSRAGRFQEALPNLQRAAQLQPADPDVHLNLGTALLQAGRVQEAVAALEKAIELKPGYHEARYNLSQALIALGRPSEAVRELREALRSRPDWQPALEVLAWVQATEADSTVRDPAEAIRLASRAADLSGGRSPTSLDALAAAYAAAGRFEEATRTAEEAAALAVGSSPALAAEIRARLNLYRAGRPLVNTGR